MRNRDLKILALSNLYPPDVIGGYEIACAQMVDGLRRRGHEVAVLAGLPRMPVSDPSHVWRRFQLVEESNWYTHDPWHHPLGQRIRDARSRQINAYNVHVMLQALDEFGPDVVYICNLVGLGGLGLLACLNYLKVPWVWQLGDNVPGLLCGDSSGYFPALAGEFSRQSHGFYIAVSRQLILQIAKSGVTLDGDVTVIPNWIVGDRSEPRTRYYRGGRLRIMSAGQVARHKGSDTLIEAAAQLRSQGKDDFQLDFYGRVSSPAILGVDPQAPPR